MQTSNHTPLHKERPPVVLPADIFPVIVRHCHPAHARTIQRLNKEIASVITANDLMWGEARWRASQSDRECWEWAAKKGHIDVFRRPNTDAWLSSNCLLDHGALLLDKPAEPDSQSGFAFVVAAGEGHLDIVKLLLDQRVYFHPVHIGDALGEAARGGHVDVVKLLLDRGVDVQEDGGNALRWAAGGGHLDVVKLLVDQGAHFFHGDDALGPAARAGHLDIVKLLVDEGVNVHTNIDEALRWAAESVHLDVVRLLLENGADVHVHFDTAFRLARNSGHKELVSLLIEYGAGPQETSHQPTSNAINGREDDGETPAQSWWTWFQEKFSPF
ncbi:hypothetical protein HK104_004210 [Borealophlyctis nickersoniae]|nr:hypothetical protein HK104_004210 [Borealophlyctis nickersoniae]